MNLTPASLKAPSFEASQKSPLPSLSSFRAALGYAEANSAPYILPNFNNNALALDIMCLMFRGVRLTEGFRAR